MNLTAPCYDRTDYWEYFGLEYSSRRVLDIGSSIGSLGGRHEFGAARARLSESSLYVSLDIQPAARPSVLADAHRLPFLSSAFDIVLANNVLEHLRDPAVAVAEMHRVLRPGGTLLYTVPFLYPVHEAPRDFVRFTEHGLRHLFREFVVVDVRPRGGWCSTVAQFVFLLTRRADSIRIGGLLRAILYPALWLFVQLDRWDASAAFPRGYYGRLRR